MRAAEVLLPERGRVFERERRVRLSDITPSGRVRLDAIARYLQDVAADDVDEAGVPGPWVLRRISIAVRTAPQFDERIALRTWCSGWGSSWAERRTTISGGGGARVESVALWVFVDATTGRPARLDRRFFAAYGASAADRKVRTRLVHPGPPPGLPARPFALRVTDLDLLDHVNNAVFWVPVEEELARVRPDICEFEAELEYHDSLDLESGVDVLVADQGPAELWIWLRSKGEVRASARVSTDGA